MKSTVKRILGLLIFFLLDCNPKGTQFVELEGKTMGTTYHISFLCADNNRNGSNENNIQASIDSILVEFNNSVSTFIPSSTISNVNKSDTLIEVDDYFVTVFKRAQEISEQTNGAFDVTVMPLVNAYGFGFRDTITMDSAVVDSMRQLVDYRNVRLIEKEGKFFVQKKDSRIQIDFSAIAKGYGVDLIGMLLERKGIENYMVEIGGEVRAKGKNGKKEGWRIGIQKPLDDTDTGHREPRRTDVQLGELKNILKLENKSLATSGNYWNFYYRNGKKVSHEINPRTGYPSLNSLLSATVIAYDCMTADAYATAFMVMGLDNTMDYLQKDSTLYAYLIYADAKGEMKVRYTRKVKEMLNDEE